MSYTSQYPTQDTDHVKATTYRDSNYYPHFTTDPTKSLVGTASQNSWLTVAAESSSTNQRFHIDLGSGKIIRRIYYENYHSSGDGSDRGAKNFTFWGSNTAGDFADLTYANDGTWTQLATSQSTFDEHVALDQPDPKYITVANGIAYRYYAFKFADNYGSSNYMGVRRIELQTEDGWVLLPPAAKTLPYILSGNGVYLRGGINNDGGVVCQVCFEVDSVNTDWMDGYYKGDIAKQFKAIDYSVEHKYRVLVKNPDSTIYGDFITIPPLDFVDYTMRFYKNV